MTVYRYSFNHDVSMAQVESALVAAITSADSLHGAAQVRLDAEVYIEADSGRCVIDASTPVGRDVNRLFVGYAERVFGADEFHVDRVERAVTSHSNEPYSN